MCECIVILFQKYTNLAQNRIVTESRCEELRLREPDVECDYVNEDLFFVHHFFSIANDSMY